MRKSHCYHSTKDKVELDLTQQEIIELHELCDYIIEVCDAYIKYLYKKHYYKILFFLKYYLNL